MSAVCRVCVCSNTDHHTFISFLSLAALRACVCFARTHHFWFWICVYSHRRWWWRRITGDGKCASQNGFYPLCVLRTLTTNADSIHTLDVCADHEVACMYAVDCCIWWNWMCLLNAFTASTLVAFNDASLPCRNTWNNLFSVNARINR